MKKYMSFLMVIILAGFLMAGCKEKSDIQINLIPPKIEPGVYTVVRVNASLLRERPATENDLPKEIRMLNQGDQIIVLESRQNWSKVQHVLSNQIGWLNNGFIQVENRSQWWSGDTDKARSLAEKLYKEKIFMERKWPVIHINIEERWNKLVFTVSEGVPFEKEEAVECAKFAMTHLQTEFPSWRDHQIFMDASQNGQKYTLILSDNQDPVFL